MATKPTMERRRSSRLARQEAAAPYSKKGGEGSGSTGLTSYMASSKLDFDDKADEPTRSFSLFGGKKKEKKEKVELPPNWKKAKDKDGTVYYFNTVTQQKSHEVPPPLPKGWREALHKDSGRVYYYHKQTRQSTFQFPTEDQADGDDMDDEMSEAEPPAAPEGFFGRTFSKFSGKKKDDGLGRTATMSRSATLSRGKKKEEKKPAAGGGSKDAAGGDGQKTVFISCSTLIREVKLCVSTDQHAALDSLYDKLTAHEIPAEQAVKVLMEMVGSTVVQQAGLSVMNAQKGVLPHGWLEYTDEASGRPYYYNVHTKVTTWYKPTGTVPPPPPPKGEEANDGISVDVTFETHNVAMSGFI